MSSILNMRNDAIGNAGPKINVVRPKNSRRAKLRKLSMSMLLRVLFSPLYLAMFFYLFVVWVNSLVKIPMAYITIGRHPHKHSFILGSWLMNNIEYSRLIIKSVKSSG